jgi:hypothetical protein
LVAEGLTQRTPGKSKHWNILYFPVAVLVGTFFVALVYFGDGAESWGREGRWVPGFLQVFTLALVGGLAVQLFFAFLLRWLTRLSGLNGVVHWIAVGAALGFALPWIFARLGYALEGVYVSSEWQSLKSAVMFPLMAAMMYEVHSAWVRLAVGAATGGTLRAIMPHLVRSGR